MANPLEDTKVLTEKYNSFYRGIVRDVNDPVGLGRVKIEVMPMFKDIEFQKLPWAEKAMIFIPPLGSWVWVFFELGDIYKPVYFANAAPVEIGAKLTEFIEKCYPSSKVTAPRSIKTINKGDMSFPVTAEQWRALVEKYFPPDQVENAMAVLLAESSGNPNAVGPTDDHGLFQITGATWSDYGEGKPLEEAYDPETNVRIASKIYASRGWQPWVTARNMGLA